ncbi:MAG: FAD-dependent oxidoreductase [Tepidisphaeraceae bacterium]
MQLHSSQTPWPVRELRAAPLEHDVDYDVAIIGGGVSGALMAYHLMRPSFTPRLRVVLLDKNRPAAGSISASTARAAV